MFARLVPQGTDPDSILFNTHLFSWLRRSYDCKSQASNPRDYIYALLGVSDDCTHGELVPNYDDREETVLEALLKLIPICLKSMHPQHRKYSDRQSRAGFFLKYAQKMGIAIDVKLQRDIAGLDVYQERRLGLGGGNGVGLPCYDAHQKHISHGVDGGDGGDKTWETRGITRATLIRGGPLPLLYVLVSLKICSQVVITHSHNKTAIGIRKFQQSQYSTVSSA
jgi:hypothetical protein